MTPHGWLPYLKRLIKWCVSFMLQLRSYYNQHLCISDRSQHNPPFTNRMSYTCQTFDSYASFRCQTPICWSRTSVWRCIPNSDIGDADFFPLRWVRSLGSQLIYLANISSISFNLKKEAATNNKSCFAVQYQTVTLNLFDLLGKTWQVLLTSTFETACVLFVLYSSRLRPSLAYKLIVKLIFNSEFPRIKRAWSRTGASDAAMQDTFVLVLLLFSKPVANRHYNSHFVAKSRSMTRRNWKNTLNQTWGEVTKCVHFLKKKHRTIKLNVFFPYINLLLPFKKAKQTKTALAQTKAMTHHCRNPAWHANGSAEIPVVSPVTMGFAEAKNRS